MRRSTSSWRRRTPRSRTSPQSCEEPPRRRAPPSGPGARRRAAAGRDAVVVQPQQLDHVLDVGLIGDPARGRSLLARKHGMVGYPPVLEQLRPYGLGKPEMRRVVAVEMADLAAADREGELAAAPRSGVHARPRGDFV